MIELEQRLAALQKTHELLRVSKEKDDRERQEAKARDDKAQGRGQGRDRAAQREGQPGTEVCWKTVYSAVNSLEQKSNARKAKLKQLVQEIETDRTAACRKRQAGGGSES